ncbi:MAG: domain protein putative component of TonB system [Myxococcaceae bacterium]|nr:domain protein putative component of TonB system [Myxococcaceae bacterium]
MRWRFGFLMIVAMLAGRVRSEAQPLTGSPTTTTDPAAADAGAMTSGASDDAAVAPRPATPAPGSTLTAPQAVPPRPAPTAAQLESLRLLEAEVDGFLERGQGFRSSVNGLLTREHDRQLGRLRAGFDRQIQAERAAEGEARRHAIQVFERFLETYPEDTERTPDVMFRLAELYYDESAYARLAAMDVSDHRREELRAQGLPTDTVQDPPIDYRCSILLYRHVISRFASFRMSDTTHYLLGWVLKEMGREEEAINAYKGMVCPGTFRYDPSQGLDLAAPLVPSDQPVVCPHLFDMLRPRAPELVSPAVAADAGAAEAGVAPLAPFTELAANQTVTIPNSYAACEPMRGPNNLPSRYAGEVWYYIGDYHFDNARDDEGNALAIAAYRASMRASLKPRPPVTNRAPAAAIQGAGEGGTQMPAAARAQFDPAMEYGVFWSKALYKVGWAFFRMQNGYPEALRNFSLLLDYYDYVGTEAATQGNRSDTIKWIGVIFSESDWGAGPGDDVNRCQGLVDQVAQPPADAARPFDCAGILRMTSPADPTQIAAAREGQPAQRAVPVPGRPTYIPQDRPWTPEAYLELANDYFQQTKYYEAITLYRLFLALYPLHERAPRVAESIAISYERQRRFDQAIDARGGLGRYTEGSAWWNANNNHPDAQRYADTVARNSLHDTALQHHQAAGQARQRGRVLAQQAASQTGAAQAQSQAEALAKLREADTEYAAAVRAYGQFIENYPNDEAAYEFRYNRADALYWSRNYQEAARAYSDVRDSNENDQFLVASAYMAVKSQESFIRLQAQRRAFDPCLALRAGIPATELTDEAGTRLLTDEQATTCAAPPATGTSVTELNIPDPVRLLMDVRIAYSNRIPPNLDTASALAEVVTVDAEHPDNNPPFRPKFAYLNARTLLRYGHAREAEALYREILRVYCTDPTVAGAAFSDINNLYVLQGRQDELEVFAREQREHPCAGVDQGVAIQIEVDAQFRHALDIYHQAERAGASEANALYERAAREMEAAVAARPTHPQAALAIYYVASANERIGRFDTATQTYQRITRDFNNTQNAAGQALAGDELAQRINILEVSNFRAAVNLERIFDFDNSIRYYNNVVSDARFAPATDHAGHVHDSLASIALINTNLGRWDAARAAWIAFAPRAEAGRERAEADFRAAEMPFKASNWAAALTSLQDYLRRTPTSADTAQFRVRAQYDIALTHRSLGNDRNYRAALREVVTVFRASGQQPGSPAAAWAAEALFRDLDDQVNEFTRVQFQQGDATALRAQIDRFKTQLRAIDTAARDVVGLRGGEYSIGALTRQGEAHEYLATQEARVGSLIQLSTAQQANFRRAEASIAQLRTAADTLDRAGRAEQAQALRERADGLQQQLDDQRTNAVGQVQASFDQEAEAERKLAIINYGTAVYTSRNQNIPTPYSARALEHMRLDENRPLVEDALSHQQVFQYRAGMFDGEAPGATVTQTTPVGGPGLVSE